MTFLPYSGSLTNLPRLENGEGLIKLSVVSNTLFKVGYFYCSNKLDLFYSNKTI